MNDTSADITVSEVVEGLGATPPPGYSSSTPLGVVYEQLNLLWGAINAMQPSDGTIAGGIQFGKDKDAVLSALGQVMQGLSSFDQSSSTYTEELVAYGNNLRSQVISLQAQCGGGSTTPATVPTGPSGSGSGGTKFSAGATGLIALGAGLLGGILGFAGGRSTGSPK